MLGDAAGLALADAGGPDGVQQSGLAVVDVTHDGDDRGADHQIVLVALVLAEVRSKDSSSSRSSSSGRDHLNDVVHLAAQQSRVSSPTDWVAVTISPRLNSA